MRRLHSCHRAIIISILHQNVRFMPTIAGACLAILRPLLTAPSRQYRIACVAILRSRTGEAGTSRLPTTPAEPWLSFFFRLPGTRCSVQPVAIGSVRSGYRIEVWMIRPCGREIGHHSRPRHPGPGDRPLATLRSSGRAWGVKPWRGPSEGRPLVRYSGLAGG